MIPTPSAASMPLAACFAGLVQYHTATPDQPLPATSSTITWIFAANGVFKRGVGASLDLLIPVGPLPVSIPGLVPLTPAIRWHAWPRRLPGSILGPLLAHARQDGPAQAIERHYLLIWEHQQICLRAAPQQRGTSTRVQYQLPEDGTILCDIHSHPHSTATFSQTDDQDDNGLSVSAVMGTLWNTPTIGVRANVYGQHWQVPAQYVFDDLGPFHDTYEEGAHADVTD